MALFFNPYADEWKVVGPIVWVECCSSGQIPPNFLTLNLCTSHRKSGILRSAFQQKVYPNFGILSFFAHTCKSFFSFSNFCHSQEKVVVMINNSINLLFFPDKASVRSIKMIEDEKEEHDKETASTAIFCKTLRTKTFKPYSNIIFAWLSVVSLAVLYNMWSIPIRAAFKSGMLKW